MNRKWYSVLSTISDIHWGSWNISPMDKGDYCIHWEFFLLFDKTVFLIYKFPLHIFFLKLYLFKNLGHLTFRVSHSLDFDNCIFMLMFNMFFFPLYFLQIVNWIQKLDQNYSLAKGFEHIDGGVFFNQVAHNVWLFFVMLVAIDA